MRSSTSDDCRCLSPPPPPLPMDEKGKTRRHTLSNLDADELMKKTAIAAVAITQPSNRSHQDSFKKIECAAQEKSPF